MLYKILILALLLASQTNAAPWNENLRWSLDLSSRARINRANDLATFGFIGLDMHKVVSTRSRALVSTISNQPHLFSTVPMTGNWSGASSTPISKFCRMVL